MAKVHGKMLKGIIGPISCRVVRGQQIVSSKPAKVRQTKATKNVAKTFGMATRLGKEIRTTIAINSDGYYDYATGTRMTTQLYDALRTYRDPKTKLYTFDEQSFSGLNHLEYNQQSPLIKNLGINLETTLADGILHLDLQESVLLKKLKFLKGSSSCTLQVCLSLFRLGDGLKVDRAETKSLMIAKNASGLSVNELEFNVPNGCLCVVSVFLKYTTKFGEVVKDLNSKTFSPGGICTAFLTAGSYDGNDERKWKRMIGLKFKQTK